MSSSSHYFVVTIKNIPNQIADLVTDFCFDEGAAGSAENLKFQQAPGQYEPVTLESPVINIDVYFEQKPLSQFFESLKSKFPELKYEISEEENKDWLTEWKKSYKSFPISQDIWVVPSWLTAPAEAKLTIEIDPGLAFGTGTHETTQLASQLLCEQKLSHKSILDVGTGTGILAILAKKLGAGEVVGIEVDEMARDVARKNIQLNNTSDIKIPDDMITAVKGEFDIVIANIIDGVLTKIQSDLIRTTKTGGYLLLSGILVERENQFMEQWPFKKEIELVERRQQGEWIALLIKKVQ